MADLSDLTGSEFGYDYRAAAQLCSAAQIESYCATTRRLFAPLAKAFSDVRHTEWLVRSYLALKFILASTVLASSAQYAAVRKHARGTHSLIEDEDAWLAMTYETADELFIDDDDRLRPRGGGS